jgi:hypothetical protein
MLCNASPLQSSQNVPLSLDRFVAASLFEKKMCDVRGRKSVFSQAFQTLNKMSPTLFRIGANERAWKVTFLGKFRVVVLLLLCCCCVVVVLLLCCCCVVVVLLSACATYALQVAPLHVVRR